MKQLLVAADVAKLYKARGGDEARWRRRHADRPDENGARIRNISATPKLHHGASKMMLPHLLQMSPYQQLNGSR